MKLNVPIVFQKQGSVDCGLVCLSMILAYYGKNFSIEGMRKEIKVYKEGTYTPQLGVFY
jgi:ABC-type bacteriocin/lantibiotic exporter with double-glycine peptidase domain